MGSGKVANLKFSEDGNTLVITTQTGMVYGYILSSAMLLSPYHELLAVLTSLTEVVIMNCGSKKKG